MRPFAATAIAITVLALALPIASAGTKDAPELKDAAGDCSFPPGNEYMDVVSAWISDESEKDFQVNLALAKFTDVVAHAAGYAVQFKHQGKQWGVTAFYDAGMGWGFNTAFVGDSGVNGFNATTGTFTPGTPAVLKIAFPKALFPHKDMMDHALREFWAGSIDLKPTYPFFFVPNSPTSAPPVSCDEAKGDGVYMFQAGQHSMGAMTGHEGMDMGNASATPAQPTGTPVTPASATPGAKPEESKKGIPDLGVALPLALLALVAFSRRGRA